MHVLTDIEYTTLCLFVLCSNYTVHDQQNSMKNNVNWYFYYTIINTCTSIHKYISNAPYETSRYF